MKVCPDCAEEVQGDAKVCRHCGYRFDGKRTGQPTMVPRWVSVVIVGGLLLFIGAVIIFGTAG